MIFYGSVENWKFDTSLAGALIPEFFDEFSQCVTRRRLHTSLLHVDPAKLKSDISTYRDLSTSSQFTPALNEVWPVVIPFNGRPYFYDTMAAAYHAVGGTPFTDVQKNAYMHFHFGCFADMVLPKIRGGDLIEIVRKGILDHPEEGIGVWRSQEAYFARQQFRIDGANVIEPITEADAKEARAWNVELCKGNQAAMSFCNQWYHYCHGIDDLIDTQLDGRPRMSKDQMIGLFFKAALLYSSDFFIANRDALLPLVLDITDTYRNSVEWERSSEAHLRAMADVFRTCGNRIFTMVALLCGGEQHMRTMSMRITERDFVLQHNADGSPK
jgi:hypothetical protein